MEFGRVENVDSIRFLLPEPDPKSLGRLTREKEEKLSKGIQTETQFRIGGVAWNVKNWRGRVYPKNLPLDQTLGVYSRQFPCIELNSTFYGIPTKSQVDKWREAAPESFRFCPKIPKEISHAPRLDKTGNAAAQFFDRIRGLGERLGVTFLQLPESFDYWCADQLEAWLEFVPQDLKLSVEFRNTTWFDRRSLRTGATRLFDLKRIGSVITDSPGRRDVCHNTLTAPWALVRFVGNGLHPSDSARLSAWANIFDSWCNAGCEDIYFMIHQPDELRTPETVKLFTEILNTQLKLNLWHWAPADGLFRIQEQRSAELTTEPGSDQNQADFGF